MELLDKILLRMVINRDKRKNYKSKPFCETDESTDDDVGQGSSLLKNPVQLAIHSDIDTRDKPSTSADHRYSFPIGNTNGNTNHNNETNGQSNHDSNDQSNDSLIEQQNVDESEESIELESSDNNTDESKEETDSSEDQPTENESKRRFV